MSTIRVSNIQDTAGSNTSTPAAIANGIAKAWVNFNGTTVVTPGSMTGVRASYNVSSVTDNGVGDYTVTFTNALTDANYAIAGTAAQSGTATNNAGVMICEAMSPADTYFTKTTTAVRVSVINNNSDIYVDAFSANVAVFR